jgi:hypothetical protein
MSCSGVPFKRQHRGVDYRENLYHDIISFESEGRLVNKGVTVGFVNEIKHSPDALGVCYFTIFLQPEIQQLYIQTIKKMEEVEAQKQKEEMQINAGFIPSGGYLVACDFYVHIDPNNPGKTRRVRIPSESLEWLLERLEKQGATQKSFEALPYTSQKDISDMRNNQEGERGGGEKKASEERMQPTQNREN